MKPLKSGMRIWIAITSLASFLGGWILFSHAGKPAPLFNSPTQPTKDTSAETTSSSTGVIVQALPTLAPIPSLDELTNTSNSPAAALNVQPLPSISSSTTTQSFSRMRTRGS
jgi:hypothetical protein